MSVVKLSSNDQINQALSIPNQLVIVDCSAEWCGPCKQFAHFYHDFATKNKDIKCYKIDVDDNNVEEFVNKNKIESLPTILFIKNLKIVGKLIGNNPNKFNEIYNSLKKPKLNLDNAGC